MDFDIKLPDYKVMPVALSAGQVVDWGHVYLKALEFYEKTRGEKAVVFILDTAGEYTHPDLVGNTLNEYAANFTTDRNRDAHGHSTHCGGIVAAVDNEEGIIGIAPAAKLVPVKVLNDAGAGSFTAVADAIRYVADLVLEGEHAGKAKIISLSLGGPAGVPTPAYLGDALDYAFEKGVFVVASAGNWSYRGEGSTVSAPGNYPGVITVASSQKPGDQRSPFSSGGPEVEVIAPGSGIYSTHKNGTYAYLSGTSMAGPQVAGVVALLVSYYSEQLTTQSELEAFLTAHATDILAKGRDDESGWGSPVLVNYRDKFPTPDPKPEPDPKPDPGPGPGPGPDPEIPPQRGRGLASIPYVFPGETFSIFYRYEGKPTQVAIVSGLRVESATNIDAEHMGRIVRAYIRDFFTNRAIVLPANFDFYDLAIYTGVFLEIIAEQTWVTKRYKTRLKLTVTALRASSGNVVVEVDEKDVKGRVTELQICPPDGVTTMFNK